MISIIVAVDRKGLIGKGDSLPWNIKEDLLYFKEKTMGKYVIMGEKTYLGIKGRLKGREVIVLSKDIRKSFQNAHVANSIEEALSLGNRGEVMIAGGKSVYEQFLKIAGRIYLTVIKKEYQGDVYFPEISEKEWRLVEEKKGKNPVLLFKVLERRRG